MILFLNVLMLFSLQRLPLFAFLLLRLHGLIANVFLPKGLFGSLKESNEQIVLQPHGTTGRKSYHLIEVFSIPSSWSDSMFLKLNFSKFNLIYFSNSSRLIGSLPSNYIPSNLYLPLLPPSLHFLLYHKLNL